MAKLQIELNAFLTERLTAAAVEISAVFQKKLVEYQEEISRSKEENKRLQRLLGLVFHPEIKLHRADSQQPSLPVSEEKVPPEKERSPNLGQEDPEPTQIKEEQEELRTSQEEEQLQGLEPDTKYLFLIPACVKIDYEQDPPLPSHLDQILENRERDSLPTNTTEQIKTEPGGEDYRVSVPTRDSQPLSEAQMENIEERVDGMERSIPPSFSPDSQQPSLPVSKEKVPPEQQERSPGLWQEDPEPTNQEELRTNQEEKQLESDSRVSEPTSDSQLLSAVNPDGSAAQSENSKVHQSPTTSSEQDSSNVESNEASHFSNWTDKNILDTDGNSLDSSSCAKEDSEARKPAKRTCHSSGVVNEPSDLSNLCDENNPRTEISPSDSNKDMNIQTDSGAHNPAKRKCQRAHNVAVARCGSGEMVACSRPKVPGSTQDYTHCMHCQGLYNRKTLWKHVRYCPLNPKADEPKPGQKMRIQSAMVFKLCPQPDYVSTGLWKIVCGMNSGEVSFVVRNDKYILLMGEEMYNKLQPDDRRNKFIPQRMREMARLLITARKCTPLMCFEDLVIPSNLPHVITAVRAVAGYNEENKTYDRPTLAVQMGYNLMNIGSAVESCALKSGQYKVAEFAGKFKGFKWNEVVMAGALSTLSEPKMKCTQPTRHTGGPADPSRRRPADPSRRRPADPSHRRPADPKKRCEIKVDR
ncbi:heat shock protein DDB_G0288861 [Coregonus clupeaformis]|uniref:heat shock protein DDB_G0288861 n=1 Tax=Coregonus clupeaformis TaxID=59861 RepID=UPI001E1C357E|nr:heat shock protein DDB_G0288861 [Coregonus clupeaformis]